MNNKNSKIILCQNIKLDKSYKNVLSYSSQEMLALCQANGTTALGYSFVRPDENEIVVSFSYQQCLNSNYIAFQNPNYSNKWFFAFIDKVRYVSDSATRISFIVDAWSTFYSDWERTDTFVIREHVIDDGYGKNTVPENLETGDTICNISSEFTEFGDSHIVMGTTTSPTVGTDGEQLGKDVGGGTYGGIYSGISYYVFKDINALNLSLKKLAMLGKTEGINCLFYAPDWLTGYETITWPSDNVAEVPNTFSKVESNGFSMPIHPTRIDGYTPKNNKLFSYPYCYSIISNNSGNTNIYKYEDFINDGSNIANFDIYGALTPGCSIKCVPNNYKKGSELGPDQIFDEGITGGKFPICNYATDVFTNWLTQNSVNIGINAVSSVLQLAGGGLMAASGVGAVAGASAILGGTMNIANSIGQIREHVIKPPQAEGNMNSGDVNFASGKLTFTYYMMNIKQEYAKIIDDYFTRFGYKVNRLKKANLETRPIFNYIQIGDSEVIGEGNVPDEYMDTINNIARVGTTIWHDHNNIGNFSLNNQ